MARSLSEFDIVVILPVILGVVLVVTFVGILLAFRYGYGDEDPLRKEIERENLKKKKNSEHRKEAA